MVPILHLNLFAGDKEIEKLLLKLKSAYFDFYQHRPIAINKTLVLFLQV